MDITLSLIVAVSHDNVIGINGEIPWKLSEDLKHFKKITSEIGIVIMGRKTYESLPFFLKDRRHIVITSQDALPPKKGADISLLHTVSSFDNAVVLAAQQGTKAVVIGGTLPYLHALESPFLKTMYLTLVKTSVVKPDKEYDHIAYFQTPDFNEWGPAVEIKEVDPDAENQFGYMMMTFQRQ